MARRRFIDHPELDLNRPEPSLGKLDSVRLTSASGQCGSIDLEEQIKGFHEFGKQTITEKIHYECANGSLKSVPCYLNEFWTAQQRQAHSLHEISYRACFKPQLPAFFIDRLTQPGDVVYDPFMGRGTTLLEAGLKGRIPLGCDINPLSQHLLLPRLFPPQQAEVEKRLKEIKWDQAAETSEELLVFYHPQTLKAICSLRNYLLLRERSGDLDQIDQWIRMVAINRLTGHSSGFFSVYSMPPNQAVSVKSQKRINERRSQTPPLRDVAAIILKKSKTLLRSLTVSESKVLSAVISKSRLLVAPADQTPEIVNELVSLVVTSPPFLDVVDYATDNWLRCWFMGFDVKSIKITMAKKVEAWEAAMIQVFKELYRISKPGGHIAFEVGEVKKGSIKLEKSVLKCGDCAGLVPQLVMINAQQFTKTANCWGVDNNAKGTNSNRIVIFRKD
ncbi:MAG: site-specific DNA-methyltransferase [Verrucomicrobia bacterium]|nr:site-specific DNA-methyltransferase [Verrucomicrobiota bacterium]